MMEKKMMIGTAGVAYYTSMQLFKAKFLISDHKKSMSGQTGMKIV
jgi:hypothetical protein